MKRSAKYVQNILDLLDTWVGYLDSTRARFPYMREIDAGSQFFRTAPIYTEDVELYYPNGLTLDQIRRNNDIAHWHNQNFILRLNALLESLKLVGQSVKLERTATGGNEVYLVRRLRNKFAHGPGKYHPKSKDARKLMREIADHFGLQDVDIKTVKDYPLGIKEVVIPLTQGCKQYIKAKLL